MLKIFGVERAQSLIAYIEIFVEFKDSGTKYKNRVKSRVMNLRDKSNPALKQNILCGRITPRRFAVMKPDVIFKSIVSFRNV